MKDWIRRRFTETIYMQKGPGKKIGRVDIPPSKRFVYVLVFSFSVLVSLTVIEALHIVFLGSFNDTVFNAINGLVGTIMGLIVGKKV